MKFNGAIIFATLVLSGAYASVKKGDDGSQLRESNICSRTESRPVSKVVLYSETQKVAYEVFCLRLPPRCTRYKYEIVYKNKTITYHVTHTEYDCCKGYEKKHESCIPVCLFGCGIHGECIEPEKCLCDAGWSGNYCDKECEVNKYGKGCSHYCSCENHGICDPRNGSCYCKEGYFGTYCEYPCENNTYGLNCEKKCQCKNGAFCNPVDGSCKCTHGYIGEYCEEPCTPGSFGSNCEELCVCVNETTLFCNHIDGKCICKPGHQGEYCEDECEPFTYGSQCENQCDCENSNFCDPVTGDCNCKAGWIGEKCSEMCPNGTFGESCIDKCLFCPYGVCNHVNGECECPPGTKGDNCDIACPTGNYGVNCSEECDCNEDSTCNHINGSCRCMAGYAEDNCTKIWDSEPDKSKISATSITNGIVASLAFMFIFIVLCTFSVKYKSFCGKCFSNIRNFKLNKDGRSNSIIDGGFSNPGYEQGKIAMKSEEIISPPISEVNRPESVFDGLFTLRRLFNRQSVESTSYDNEPDQKIKDSTHENPSIIDISSTNPFADVFRDNCRSTKQSAVTSTQLYDDISEDYIPEVLSDDFCVQENVYEDCQTPRTANVETIKKKNVE